jgi:Tol biopolymer transport system component/predicted Ser/Thr protein kinase
MALESGFQLGPYEIESPIGAGGMGEVYKAKDRRLERTVAIKVLPSEVSRDEALRQRLEREAKTISSLNHPNICTLHDIGRQDDIDYLVMEYIEGETLADRLSRGSIPAEEMLEISTQIAGALDKAHRGGVIHRDLKPGNVMLTRTGVKLLDFGLAKMATQEPGQVVAGLSAMATAHSDKPLTEQGTILGTFQYMAPEQLEGKEADARTDIFAFGAVMYEMATGKKAFEGESQASLIGAIMNSNPKPISELQPMSPPALENLVRACLAKNPDDRLQTAHDARLQLQWIAEGGSQLGVPAQVATRRRSRERFAWIAAGVLGVIAAVVVLPRLLNPPAKPAAVRLAMLPPEDTLLDSNEANMAVSPDGSMVAFLAADTTGTPWLWIRSLKSQTARALPGTDTPVLPFWSPDNRFVGFFSDGQLKKIDVMSGEPQIICRAPSGRGGTWNEDGVILIAPFSSGAIYRVPASGGEPVAVTVIDTSRGEVGHRFPSFLPDGRHFLYVVLPGNQGLYETRVASLDSDESSSVISAAGVAIYAEPGYLLVPRQQSIEAIPFDASKREITGDALATGETQSGQAQYTGAGAVSVSKNGVLVHPVGFIRNTRLEWFDRSGGQIGTVSLPAGNYQNVRLSPDGRRLAVELWDSSVSSGIWTVDLARSVPTKLTFARGYNYAPIWSPDGRRIAFTSDRDGGESIYVKLSSGSGGTEKMPTEKALFQQPSDWAPGGRYLVYEALFPNTNWDLWVLDLAEGGKSRPFLNSPYSEWDGVVSPDGNWIAYRSDETGSWEIFVESFPTPGNKTRISTDGAFPFITWSRDGQEIIFTGGDGNTMMSVDVKTGATFEAGIPRVLFRKPRGGRSITPTPDRQRFLVAVPVAEGASSVLSVVLNWSAALEDH